MRRRTRTTAPTRTTARSRYAPGGSNECGGKEVPKNVRKRWFDTLKASRGQPVGAEASLLLVAPRDAHRMPVPRTAWPDASRWPAPSTPRGDAFWRQACRRSHGARTVYAARADRGVAAGRVAGPRDRAGRRAATRAAGARVASIARIRCAGRRASRRSCSRSSRAGARRAAITGIQIDFDARTRHLQDYLEFLRALRDTLPADCRLSITGLPRLEQPHRYRPGEPAGGSSTRWSCRLPGPPHDPRLCGLPAARRAAAAVSHRHHPGRRMGRAAVPRDESVVRGYVVFLRNDSRQGAAVTRLSAPDSARSRRSRVHVHPRGDARFEHHAIAAIRVDFVVVARAAVLPA